MGFRCFDAPYHVRTTLRNSLRLYHSMFSIHTVFKMWEAHVSWKVLVLARCSKQRRQFRNSIISLHRRQYAIHAVVLDATCMGYSQTPSHRWRLDWQQKCKKNLYRWKRMHIKLSKSHPHALFLCLVRTTQRHSFVWLNGPSSRPPRSGRIRVVVVVVVCRVMSAHLVASSAVQFC